MRFEIRPDQRVVILGRPGTGKTVLARILVGGYGSLVAVDPKRRLELASTITTEGVRDFRNTWPQRSRRVVFRPPVDDDREAWAAVDEALRRVFHYGRTAVLVDETVDIAQRARIVPAYRRILRLGRELLIPTFSLSQSPIDLHNDVLRMADHIVVFDLPVEGDRKKVAGIVGNAVLERADDHFPQGHGFLYYGPATSGNALWCAPLDIPAGQLPAAPYAQPGAPPGTEA